MGIDHKSLVHRLIKTATESGRSITEAEAIHIANDDFFSGLFSFDDPTPQHDQRIAAKIEEYFQKSEEN